MSNLKPCPFCGEKEDISYEFGGSQGYMRCLSCNTYGPSGENEADPEWDGDAAYEAWNKRATKSEAEQDKREEVEQQLAKANERIEELQDALVDDAKAKAMLNKLAMENGELNIKASGNIFHVFCETFVETFKAAGATNYLVAEFNSEELGAFTVTMQRSEGLTVYQKLNDAVERVAELEQANLELAANVEACCELTDMDMGAAIERLFEIDNTESKALLNKFAIEKKIEALKSFASYAKGDDWEDAHLQEAIKIEIEQLRKEQE